MTDQWTPPRPGAHRRELFAAFLCDETACNLMRAACLDLGWPVDRINKGGLRNAVQTLSVSASPSILFVDLSECQDPLRDINALAEVCEPGTIVITGGQVNDVRLYRDLLASGIQDYLLKPFHPDQMREALSHAHALVFAPRSDDQMARPQVSISIVGAKGGCGASSLAAGLAWSIADQERLSTALLDLDVHFGTSALALDLEPGKGLTDAIENPILARAVLPIVLGSLAVVMIYLLDHWPDMSPLSRFMWTAGALIAGYKGPDVFIQNSITKRLEAIRLGLPDALDLLVICAEAGLTVDAAFSRTARELGSAYPELADEFGLTAVEIGFLTDRRQAFLNLAARIPLESIKGVATTMIQTEKYGTPLASALRVLSAEFRNERMMRAEAKAARLPAIMTVPLILFVLPALFIIILGPAACSIMDTLK